ncbi:MAG: fatty acid CoA ligase family protein [Planctomycetota bacterium]
MSDAVNIAEHLTRMAERYPHKRAVVCPVGRDAYDRVAYTHLTFEQLERETDRYARGLERAGLTRGMRTILMVRPSLEFFALAFALFKIGAVPVLIDPGIGRQNLVKCLASVRAEAFIGIPLAHVLRTLYRSAFRSVRVAVTVGTRYFWGGLHVSDVRAETCEPYVAAPTRPDEQAAILFTSGSTGPPKGVIYEHGMFDAQVRYLQSHYGYSPEEIDLATFPLFALFDAALGMTAVIPDMDATRPGAADPVKLVEAIHNQGCSHMFGSPALLRRLAAHGEATGVQVPSLKRIITAGAPIPPALLASLRKMLADDAAVHTPYGATESLPVTDIADGEILGETAERTAAGGGTCVGRALPGMDVRIIEITDEPIATWVDACELPAGQIGEIAVRGPVVTREYFEQPAANAAAKIQDDAEGRIWHRMGDVGYLDEQGRLWFCGRKAHRVKTPDGLLFTVPCEAIFNQHPRVFRTALVGVGTPGESRPVLCVELEADARTGDREQIKRELLELGAANDLTRDIQTILFHDAFPVDVRHNAKIFREKLAVWAAERVK